MSFCGTLLAWFTCVLCFFFSFHPFFVVVLVYEVSSIHVMRLESTFFFVQYNGWCMTFLCDDVASVCVFFSCQSAFCVLFFFFVCLLFTCFSVAVEYPTSNTPSYHCYKGKKR